MRKYNLIFLAILFSLIVIVCKKEKPAVVEDIVKAAPDKVQVLLDNDWVLVTQFTLQPGDKLPMHKGGPRVIYSLSNYELKWQEGEAEAKSTHWHEGDVHWHDALPHAVENIGTSEAKYLVVTRKEKPLPDASGYDIEQDASHMDSEHSRVLLDNEAMRVVAVELPPGAKQELHHGINRIIYSLNNYTILYGTDKGEGGESTFAAGDVHWHQADQHAVENIGDTDANYVIFSLKK
jgi:quercetin dioxygenase-like cupin family protein